MAGLLKSECRIIAPDLRGHGQTVSGNDADLSATTLSADVAALWQTLCEGMSGVEGSNHSDAFNDMEPSQGGLVSSAVNDDVRRHASTASDNEASTSAFLRGLASGPSPAICFVGHSMGASIAVRASTLIDPSSVQGIIVIDVVEGTALASLPYMRNVLEHRPRSFTTLEAAIDWSMHTGMCRNRQAARISMPGMLKMESSNVGAPERSGSEASLERSFTQRDASTTLPFEEDCKTRMKEQEHREPEPRDSSCVENQPCAVAAGSWSRVAPPSGLPPIREADIAVGVWKPSTTGNHRDAGVQGPYNESGEETAHKEDSHRSVGNDRGAIDGTGRWVWRTPLMASAPYWTDWYKGLSKNFLSIPAPKMLMLAGTDRLDKELTIAQMQGKFQLVVLPRAGHAIQEDDPEKVAEAIARFVKRFRIGQLQST